MNKLLPVTDLKMTRFSITMNDAIDLVYNAIKKSFGGEIFIPKIPSYKLSDLVKAIKSQKRVIKLLVKDLEKKCMKN